MKEKDRRRLLKNILCFALCLVCSFSCILFAGCSIDGGDDEGGGNSTFYTQYIDGFKVVYANSIENSGGQTTIAPLANDFFLNILQEDNNGFNGLAYYYGSANIDATTNAQWFPDSIRMLATKNNTTGNVQFDISKKWQWTFSTALEDNATYYDVEDMIYQNWKNVLWNEDKLSPMYAATFTNMYTIPLTIVMYEIMLGYDYEDLTTFAPTTAGDNAGKVAQIVTCPKSTSLNGVVVGDADGKATTDDTLLTTNVQTYLNSLVNRYQKTVKYVAFTKDNADNMINYVLDNIIGFDLVKYDYETFRESSTYRTAVTEANYNAWLTGDTNFNHIVKVENIYYDYYNYRNYVERVASTIYSMTYDGLSTYEFTKELDNDTTLTYDYADAHTDVEGNLPEKGQFNAAPATFLKDFNGEAFFGDPNAFDSDDDTFSYANNPKAEYQSVVVMPKTFVGDAFTLESGFWFEICAYDPSLVIRTSVRYYYWDESTHAGTLYVFDCDDITFNDATAITDTVLNCAAYETDFEVGVDADDLPEAVKVIQSDGSEAMELTRFDNNDNIKTNGTEISLNSNKPTNNPDAEVGNYSRYYKIIPSKNGFGGITVLDETKMQCSYYEIVFDVVKSLEDPIEKIYDSRIAIVTPW